VSHYPFMALIMMHDLPCSGVGFHFRQPNPFCGCWGTDVHACVLLRSHILSVITASVLYASIRSWKAVVP
jgi:hypothetical protein